MVRAAMANWTKTLASELGRFGITVNNVMPGFTKTARLEALFKGKASRGGTTVDEVERDAIGTIPAGRLADPRELALAMLFLASPAASYVNGEIVAVNGGGSMGLKNFAEQRRAFLLEYRPKAP